MKSRLIIRLFKIFVFALVVLCGCNKNQAPVSISDGNSGELIIVENFDTFNPDDIQIDPFAINEVRMAGDFLTLSVSYSGGCQLHHFTLYSTRAVMESQPPQANAWLSHNGNGDLCEAYLTEEIEFNLSELKESERGSLLLRLHPYRQQTPIDPLILYEW